MLRNIRGRCRYISKKREVEFLMQGEPGAFSVKRWEGLCGHMLHSVILSICLWFVALFFPAFVSIGKLHELVPVRADSTIDSTVLEANYQKQYDA